MKLLIVLLALLLTHASYADDLRDLSAYPLTETEEVALRAAGDLAAELGEKVNKECVNASFMAGTMPVHVQFYVQANGEEQAYCVDPHYSIRVRFSAEDRIQALEVLDN